MIVQWLAAALVGAAPGPHVPAPPVLPAAGAFTGHQRLEERKTLREAYRLQLEAFLGQLSPDQAKELLLDETETEHLALARAFLRGVDPRTGKDVVKRRLTVVADDEDDGPSHSLVGGQNGNGLVGNGQNGNSQTVYRASECVGPVIGGVCRGLIAPDGGYHQTCHGQMLNGMCTGPEF